MTIAWYWTLQNSTLSFLACMAYISDIVHISRFMSHDASSLFMVTASWWMKFESTHLISLVMIYRWEFHDTFSVFAFGKALLSDLTSIILLWGQPLKHCTCFWCEAWTLTSLAYLLDHYNLWWPVALVRWPVEWWEGSETSFCRMSV